MPLPLSEHVANTHRVYNSLVEHLVPTSDELNDWLPTLRDVAPGTGLSQDVDYAYNVRGWLTGLNADLVSGATPAAVSKDLWGMTLSYDCGFAVPQFNGNIAGQQWRDKHDGVAWAYGYVYDRTNRLLYGNYVAQNAAGGWNAEQQRFALAGLRYDENGNSLALQWRGLLQNATRTAGKQFGPVDNLSYAYAGNRLQAVNDGVGGNQLARPANYHGAPASLAGDFQEQGVRQAQQYAYDPNGSLTKDRNKGITRILYNHLNLPRLIHFGTGADSLVFRYSAGGQKVTKLVYQTGKPPQRTDYLGPYQYEGDSLRFFPHAEGRVLRFVQYDAANQPRVRYEREFTVKDHLGNLRLAYRTGQVRTYRAGLEPVDAKRETHQFDSLSVSPPVAQDVSTSGPGGSSLARTGAWAAKVNAGGPAPQPLGPLLQLAVQKGDTVTVTAPGLYPQATQHGFLFSLASFLANLLHPAQSILPGLDGRKRADLPLLNIGVAAGLAGLPQLGSGVPKGYLRVLVFGPDSALVDQQTRQLSTAALNNYETLRLQVVVPKDGYVTAYVGNESDADVFFDDVTIEHRQGLQVQENQYDPFGLDLAGVSGAAPGLKLKNFYQFNGKENQLDLGLNWNHQDWRFFDYQIGRWHAVDPKTEEGQENWTPYQFGYDNAVRFEDADGREPGDGYTNSQRASAYFGGFGQGFASAATGLVSSLYQTARHPINTANAVVSAARSVITHPVESAKSAAASIKQSAENIVSKDPAVAGKAMGGLVFGAALTAATVGGGRVLSGASEAGAIANPIPARLARVISADVKTTSLGAPNATDVFVTAAKDIKGMNAAQIAERLTIPPSESGFNVIEFNTPKSGIASPYNRTNPGFINGGKAAGGAREFVIPNGPIPKGATSTIVQ